jgi:hypothetical protein
MVRANLPLGSTAEQVLAELAAAACRVAGQDGRGALIDDELDLWYALQDRLGPPSVISELKGGARP